MDEMTRGKKDETRDESPEGRSDAGDRDPRCRDKECQNGAFDIARFLLMVASPAPTQLRAIARPPGVGNGLGARCSISGSLDERSAGT